MTSNRIIRKKRISRYGHGAWYEYYYGERQLTEKELVDFANYLISENEKLTQIIKG